MTWRTFTKSRHAARALDEAEARGSVSRPSHATDGRGVSIERNDLDRYVPVRRSGQTGTYLVDQPGTLPFTRLASGFHMINGSSVEAPAPSVLLVGLVGHRFGQFATAEVPCKAM